MTGYMLESQHLVGDDLEPSAIWDCFKRGEGAVPFLLHVKRQRFKKKKPIASSVRILMHKQVCTKSKFIPTVHLICDHPILIIFKANIISNVQ